MTNAYELDTIGKIRPLAFAVASYGAKVSNHLHQAIAGCKVVDIGVIDPVTNRLVKPQTRDAHCPEKIVLGRETTSMHINTINPICNWWEITVPKTTRVKIPTCIFF